nr:hypothetical protein [Tanacetum cinerariifolium]
LYRKPAGRSPGSFCAAHRVLPRRGRRGARGAGQYLRHHRAGAGGAGGWALAGGYGRHPHQLAAPRNQCRRARSALRRSVAG